MIALVPAGLAVTGALVLAVAAFAGGWIVAAAAGLIVLALAVGWADLLRLPHRSGTSLVVGGLGSASLVAGALAAAPGSRWPEPLAVLAAVVAIAVLTSFAHELLRQDGRRDVVESLTGTLTGQVAAVLAVGWVLLVQTRPGSSGVVVAVAALAASRIAGALPLPGPVPAAAIWGSLGAGVVAAVAASLVVENVPVATAVLVSLGVGGIGLAVDHLLGPVPERGFDLSLLARAALPVAAAGTTAYAVIRMGIG